jgi:hypothetical protein
MKLAEPEGGGWRTRGSELSPDWGWSGFARLSSVALWVASGWGSFCPLVDSKENVDCRVVRILYHFLLSIYKISM